MAYCPVCREPMLTEWPHFHRDALTVDVGFVHVRTEVGGSECVDDCPHPDHQTTPVESSGQCGS